MGMKIEGDTITCDCGFSFQRGHSGKHECADGLRAKLAAAVRREEGMKAIVDVMGLRITELEQRQQQPAYPEKLPCAVHLLPGLKLGKGVATKTLLEALARRERYNAGMASMTLEQQADHEDAVNVIKAMMPAPAVTDERTAFENFVAKEFGELVDQRRAKNGDNEYMAWDMAMAWIVWQGRSAMIQPVIQGYTLNSPVIPDGWKLVPMVELTEKMVIHGFESEAFEALADAVLDKKGWPYSCRESAECVTGIFKAMVEVAPSPGGPDDSHAAAT